MENLSSSDSFKIQLLRKIYQKARISKIFTFLEGDILEQNWCENKNLQ